MASHRTKRAVRGALSISAIVTAVSLSPSPALAQPADPPPPSTASEALKQFQDLSAQATKVNEDLLAAQNDLNNKNAEFTKATADLAAAQAAEAEARTKEQQFRGSIDALANASFQGARFSNLSALLTEGDQQDFLDRASALNVLASENERALRTFTDVVAQAEKAHADAADAQRRAQEAKAAAEQLVSQVTQTKTDLEARVKDADAAYDRLSGKDKAELQGPADTGVYLAPPGAAQAAVQTALDQVGDMYLYGAEGPNRFDCSGLTMYAYRAAGVSLPHSSRAQYQLGKPVAKGQWISGDLLFYGGSPGTIHHVAMFIGDGNVVHASTSGTPVKVVPFTRTGSDYLGAKRIVG